MVNGTLVLNLANQTAVSFDTEPRSKTLYNLGAKFSPTTRSRRMPEPSERTVQRVIFARIAERVAIRLHRSF